MYNPGDDAVSTTMSSLTTTASQLVHMVCDQRCYKASDLPGAIVRYVTRYQQCDYVCNCPKCQVCPKGAAAFAAKYGIKVELTSDAILDLFKMVFEEHVSSLFLL
jgi:hypothetical protein